MFRVVIIVVVIASFITLIGKYLGPNDLAGCGDSPSKELNCKEVDAIIAVSGGDTKARTEEAVSLFKRGWASQLVLSGAAKDKTGQSNADAMRDIAVALGVPYGQILVDEQSETTKQNANEIAEILKKDGVSSVILVTSAYHQRRASLELANALPGVQIRNHPTPTDNQWSNWWWLTPSGWFLAIGELVRIVMFYLGISR